MRRLRQGLRPLGVGPPTPSWHRQPRQHDEPKHRRRPGGPGPDGDRDTSGGTASPTSDFARAEGLLGRTELRERFSADQAALSWARARVSDLEARYRRLVVDTAAGDVDPAVLRASTAEVKSTSKGG